MKYRNEYILDRVISLKHKVIHYNFACGSVWVRKLVSNIKGGTQTDGVWKQVAEDNIWTEERRSDGRLEETA
jgi:hypothetical protein